MLIEDEGIVLRQWPLGEAGAIFSVLTRRHGKARLVSNSIKKNKSMRSSLAPFMRDSFVYWKGKSELSRLSQSSLLSPFGLYLSSDYDSYLAACLMAEITDKLFEPFQGEESDYLLLWGALSALSKKKRKAWKILLSYELRIVANAGWRPEILACAECGREGDFLSFSMQKGGWVCQKCASADAIRFSKPQKELFCALLLGEWEKCREPDGKVEKLIKDWVNYYLDRKLNSLKVIREKI